MKVILISFVFILIQSSLIAQDKGDNTLIIPHHISYSKIKLLLFQRGYVFESSDTSFITTKFKELPNSSLAVLFNIAITETEVIIKGFNNQRSDKSPSQIEFNYVFHKPTAEWEEIDDFAKLLSPDVRYTKQ